MGHGSEGWRKKQVRVRVRCAQLRDFGVKEDSGPLYRDNGSGTGERKFRRFFGLLTGKSLFFSVSN